MPHIVQKKGSPDRLSGIMLAYARILPGGPREKEKNPWEDAVKNGLLVVSGNFIGQNNLKDFIRREFGSDDDDSEGMENFLEHLRQMGINLSDDGDAETLRQRLESLSGMELIPVPARVVQFESEQELLNEKADIFWVGDFRGVAQAHLAVTSFPILYQAWYREQVSGRLQEEIEAFLHQIASAPPPVLAEPSRGDPVVLQLEGDLSSFKGNLMELLTARVIPNLVYNLGYPREFELSMRQLRKFMAPYRRQQDLDHLEAALRRLRDGDSSQEKIVEQLCRLISAFHHEEFENIPAIQRELSRLHQENSKRDDQT